MPFFGIETQKKELGYCIIDKREEFVTSSREWDKFLEQEKKEEERGQSLKLAKKEHVQVEHKRLKNLKVALEDISTEVFRWKMAVRFNMSNKEESGTENYSMIHTTDEILIVGDIDRGYEIALDDGIDDGKSVAGHIFFGGGRSITWDSSKQETVVSPSC